MCLYQCPYLLRLGVGRQVGEDVRRDFVASKGLVPGVQGE